MATSYRLGMYSRRKKSQASTAERHPSMVVPVEAVLVQWVVQTKPDAKPDSNEAKVGARAASLARRLSILREENHSLSGQTGASSPGRN